MIRVHEESARSALRSRADRGFSLIELLVVVAVLGVLAAIAVPSWLGAQNGAKDASVQADLANAKKALTAFGTDHDGDLPTTVTRSGTGTYGPARVDMTQYGWTAGSNTARLVFSRNAGDWCVLGTSSTGAAFAVTSTTGVAKSSACPA